VGIIYFFYSTTEIAPTIVSIFFKDLPVYYFLLFGKRMPTQFCIQNVPTETFKEEDSICLTKTFLKYAIKIKHS